MSRAIKFRVWDNEGLKWLDNGYLRAQDGTVELYEYDSWEKAWTTRIQKPGRLLAEQFTGLLDSQGKEIYEGDIVEYFDWCYASDRQPNGRPAIECWFEPHDKDYAHTDVYYPMVGVVTWDPLACTWAPTISSQEDFNESSFAYVCRKPDPSKCGIPMLNSRGLPNYPDPYYRVIGNIHEHPHLLTQQAT